jgi:hypothetical protein
VHIPRIYIYREKDVLQPGQGFRQPKKGGVGKIPPRYAAGLGLRASGLGFRLKRDLGFRLKRDLGFRLKRDLGFRLKRGLMSRSKEPKCLEDHVGLS